MEIKFNQGHNKHGNYTYISFWQNWHAWLPNEVH